MNSANVCNLICCQKVEYRYKIVFIVVCTDRNFGSGIPHIGIHAAISIKVSPRAKRKSRIRRRN